MQDKNIYVEDENMLELLSTTCLYDSIFTLGTLPSYFRWNEEFMQKIFTNVPVGKYNVYVFSTSDIDTFMNLVDLDNMNTKQKQLENTFNCKIIKSSC